MKIPQVARLTISDFALCRTLADYEDVIFHQMTLAGFDLTLPWNHTRDIGSLYLRQTREVSDNEGLAWSLLGGVVGDQYRHHSDNKVRPLCREQ